MARRQRVPKAKADFRAELEAAGLSQAGLAAFLGKSTVTVNRWCVAREDAMDVPQYARAFVSAYRMLPAAARRRLAAEFGVKY